MRRLTGFTINRDMIDMIDINRHDFLRSNEKSDE